MAVWCDLREESILRTIYSVFEKTSVRNNPQIGNSEIGKYHFFCSSVSSTQIENIFTLGNRMENITH